MIKDHDQPSLSRSSSKEKRRKQRRKATQKLGTSGRERGTGLSLVCMVPLSRLFSSRVSILHRHIHQGRRHSCGNKQGFFQHPASSARKLGCPVPWKIVSRTGLTWPLKTAGSYLILIKANELEMTQSSSYALMSLLIWWLCKILCWMTTQITIEPRLPSVTWAIDVNTDHGRIQTPLILRSLERWGMRAIWDLK